MREILEKTYCLKGRNFYLMRDVFRKRLWEIVTSHKKFSAQMVEIKSPEKELLIRQLERSK